MDSIKIPFVVSREERSQIKEAYLTEIDEANEEKVHYIKTHLPKVIKRLRKSDEEWLVRIAEVASQLTLLLRKDSRVSKAGRRELVAALYYLCNPFEVIPDHVPGRGYADDALVLNACVSRLRQRGVEITIAKARTTK